MKALLICSRFQLSFRNFGLKSITILRVPRGRFWAVYTVLLLYSDEPDVIRLGSLELET